MVNTIFYKIFLNENPQEFYIGSCLDLTRRKSQHKKNTTNKVRTQYWNNLYFFIRLKGGWDKMTMIKIYEYDCQTKDERNQYEQALIDLLRPTLNSVNVILEKNKPDLTEIKNRLKDLNL